MTYTKIKIKKYDTVWAKKVRDRDARCLVCNAVTSLNAHHFIGRATKTVRLMLDNGITLCASHHVFSSEFSAHKTPEKFKRWFKKTFPKRYKAIMAKLKKPMTERAAILEFKELYEGNSSPNL